MNKCNCHDAAYRHKKDDYPHKCPTIPNRIHVRCEKCGNLIALDFSNLTEEQARKALHDYLDTPQECPGGWHVELSFWRLWQAEKALALQYIL